ncbi:MAG: hypothetical protein NZ570_05315, partial [Candidatus Caldarchaeum sp.]|nr:hypothetical protein [Candidatus Caldarchaeum sp.]
MLSTNLLAACVAAALTSIALIPLSKAVSKKTGCMGIDVHKTPSYPVPKLGGLIVVGGVMAGYGVASPYLDNTTLAFYFSTALAAFIGLYEDFREVNPILKPMLLALAGVPVLFFGTYSPNPVIPFVGNARLTIVYPLLVLIGYAVVCNAVNSIDVLNGSLAYTTLAALIPLSLASLLEAKTETLALCLVLAVSLTVFLSVNKYPSKVFAGNVGSLFIGAALTFITITGRLEVLAIVALIPQIMNEFHIIFSMRGLKSAKNSVKRPVLVENGKIKASREREAP